MFDNDFYSDDKLDMLLLDSAQQLTQKVDFNSIKQRAILQNNAKKCARRKLIRHTVIAACMVVCFGILGVAMGKELKDRPTKANWDDKEAFGKTPEGNEDIIIPDNEVTFSEYTKCINVGVLSSDKGKINNDTIKNLYPDKLPDYMEKRSIEKNDLLHNVAYGEDKEGNGKYFDLFILAYAPYRLVPGEVGIFAKERDITFYWQFSSDRVICARFVGFDNAEATEMFNGMIDRIRG